MMYGRGYYGAETCDFLGPVMMIGVVILVVVIVFLLLKSNKSNDTKSNQLKSNESRIDDSNALAILKEKFAKGEITEEEYLNKKNILERR